MKKLLSIIMSIMLFLSATTICMPYVSAKSKERYRSYGGYTYALIGKDAQIVDYYGKESTIKIPSKLQGHKVVKIGSNEYIEDYSNYPLRRGFKHNKYIKNVTVPDTVIEIVDGSFSYCPNLKKITLGNGIDRISTELFANCKMLKSIKLPSGIKAIEANAFDGTGLKTITIPQNVSYIDSCAFERSKLAKITVSKNNKKYSSKNGVLYNKKMTQLHCYPPYKKGTKFTIPTTVTKIMQNSFFDNKKLKKVVISNNVKKIKETAFCDCSKLINVVIPKNVDEIEYYAFGGCSNLKNVEFKTKKKLKIGSYVFMDCKALKSVTIPPNVIKISSKAFGFYWYTGKDHIVREVKYKNFTIKGKVNSAAHKYAKKYKFNFVKI